MKLIQRENGLWNPDTDVKNPETNMGCFEYTLAELENIPYLANQCDELGIEKKNVVHAGGNIGMYALEFAKHFKNVYVFEPEKDNFSALMLNCHIQQNIYPYKAALGHNNRPTKMTDDCNDNIGAWQVTGQSGNIPVIRLDDLNLNDVSLIHLDVEGFELFALYGAEKTIKRWKPLIAFEVLNHGLKYGYKYQDIENYLVSLGYNMNRYYGNEVMFYFKEQ